MLGCTVELSCEEDSQQYCFKLVFLTPGEVRSYYLAAENQGEGNKIPKIIKAKI
jgi:hypothetical protein